MEKLVYRDGDYGVVAVCDEPSSYHANVVKFFYTDAYSYYTLQRLHPVRRRTWKQRLRREPGTIVEPFEDLLLRAVAVINRLKYQNQTAAERQQAIAARLEELARVMQYQQEATRIVDTI